MAISSDTLVVGAYGEASAATGVNGNQADVSAFGSGAAYVFVRSGTNWIQQAYLKASNTRPRSEAQFGWAVAISGDTIVVGAPFETSGSVGVNGDESNEAAPDSGAAYVFVRTGTNWAQQAYLKASNTGTGDRFGHAVSISGDTIVVGARGESSSAIGVNGTENDDAAPNSGAAYVFTRAGANWSQQAYLKASNTDSKDQFGWAVTVEGDTLAVSAMFEASNSSGIDGNQINNSSPGSGAVYVFLRNGANWTQQTYIKASNNPVGNLFGGSLAMAGGVIVVGARADTSSATGVNGSQADGALGLAGAAFVFARNGMTWIQEAYLKASNTGANDYFGYSVAASGQLVAVGAAQESSSAAGLNGDEGDNSAPNSGAGYVFAREGTNWTQLAYVKSSNPGTSDYFGRSVSISGTTVVFGADWEPNNTYKGAAHVFSGFGISPRLTITSDGTGGYFLRFLGAQGVAYRLERATTLNGVWEPLATITAPASGLVEFHETATPPGQAFYRTTQP